jgi:hypothetical protein
MTRCRRFLAVLMDKNATNRLFRRRRCRLLTGPSILAEAGTHLEGEEVGLLVHIQPCMRVGVDPDTGDQPVPRAVLGNQQREVDRLTADLCLSTVVVLR